MVKRESLVPGIVGPYDIFKQVGKVSNELKLPSEVALVHLIIHVSMINKCMGDQVSILPIKGLGVNENLSYEEVPVDILDHQVKKMRTNMLSP